MFYKLQKQEVCARKNNNGNYVNLDFLKPKMANITCDFTLIRNWKYGIMCG